MKEFFKFTLATIVGIILSSVVMLLVGIMIIVGVVSASESETQVKDNSILFLDLNGELLERTEDNPLKQFVGESFASYGLDDVLASIEKAKNNDKIKGIYIQTTSLGSSFASIEEIRNALLDFKKSGKFIVAYGDVYSQELYYLASVADKIMLNPQGSVDWKGLASQPIFYKDILNKLGVEMQVFKVGTYKSAVEPFIATEMSPANREQVTAFMGSIWNKLLNDVSASRKITIDSLNSYADKKLFFYPAEESVKCGLADTLVYKDGVRSYLKKLVKVDEDDDLNLLSLEDMINIPKDTPKNKSDNVVAIYYAYGEIDGATEEGIVSKKVVKDLHKLREDKKIKAVVLRVNSPGGSAFGSEQILHEVVLLKAKKPVIVSMGDYAASGGYYISCAADYILAQPTTLTGSIGIFGMFPNVKGLTDKVGLGFDIVKTNKYSDFGAMGRGLNTDELSLLQMNVNNGYKLF
ncbi:MAG: signal peptide peptidase SppA, partial [Bacteroidaceae bacterium]